MCRRIGILLTLVLVILVAFAGCLDREVPATGPGPDEGEGDATTGPVDAAAGRSSPKQGGQAPPHDPPDHADPASDRSEATLADAPEARPEARIVLDRDRPVRTGQNVTFHAAGEAPAGTTYRWTIGDAQPVEGPTVHHVFTENGTHPVVLTALQDNETRDTDRMDLMVYQTRPAPFRLSDTFCLRAGLPGPGDRPSPTPRHEAVSQEGVRGPDGCHVAAYAIAFDRPARPAIGATLTLVEPDPLDPTPAPATGDPTLDAFLADQWPIQDRPMRLSVYRLDAPGDLGDPAGATNDTAPPLQGVTLVCRTTGPVGAEPLVAHCPFPDGGPHILTVDPDPDGPSSLPASRTAFDLEVRALPRLDAS